MERELFPNGRFAARGLSSGGRNARARQKHVEDYR